MESPIDTINLEVDKSQIKSKDVGYILSKMWRDKWNKHVSESGPPPGPIDSSFFQKDYYKSLEEFYERFLFIDESSWIKLKDSFGLSDDIVEQHVRREAAYIGGNRYEFKLICHKMTFKSTGVSPLTVTETFEKPMEKDIIQEFVRIAFKFSGEIVYQKYMENELEDIKDIAKYLENTEVIVSEKEVTVEQPKQSQLPGGENEVTVEQPKQSQLPGGENEVTVEQPKQSQLPGGENEVTVEQSRQSQLPGGEKEVIVEQPKQSQLPGEKVMVKEKKQSQLPVYFHQSSWDSSLYGGELPPGIRGLQNTAGNCYMNSALQCLLRVSELCQLFLTSDDIKGSVALSFKQLVWDMYENSHKPLDTRNLKKVIDELHPQFCGSSQQDINQLIIVLLNCLHDDLNKFQSVTRSDEIYDLDDPNTVEIRSENEKKWYLESNQSPIAQIFHGLFRSSFLCAKCGSRIIINYEPFSSLALPLPIESYLELKVHVVRGNENWRSFRISILRGSLYRAVMEKIVVESGLQLNSDEMVIAKLSENKIFDGIVGMDDPIDTNPNTELCIYCLEDSVIQRPDMFLIYIRRREHLEYPPLLHIIEFCDETAEPDAVELLLQEFFHNNLRNFRVESVRRGEYFLEVWIRTDEYLNVEKSVQCLSANQAELKECFQLFTTKERLSSDITYNCPQCDEQTEMFKKFDFAVLPNVLIIQLKRFNSFSPGREKLNNLVRIPLEDLKLQQDVKPKEVSYHLIAVANHSGNLNSGHYTVYGRDINHKKWFLFDDSVVRPLRFEEQKMDNAIVLVYRKDSSSSTSIENNEEGKQQDQ